MQSETNLILTLASTHIAALSDNDEPSELYRERKSIMFILKGFGYDVTLEQIPNTPETAEAAIRFITQM